MKELRFDDRDCGCVGECNGIRHKVRRPESRKRRYVERHLESLTIPTKHPPPVWLSDPSLLPKRPPGFAHTE